MDLEPKCLHNTLFARQSINRVVQLFGAQKINNHHSKITKVSGTWKFTNFSTIGFKKMPFVNVTIQDLITTFGCCKDIIFLLWSKLVPMSLPVDIT